MRWPVNYSDSRPLSGTIRYRIKFAWLPVRTTSGRGIGFASWPEEMIWLERVIDVQQYWRRGPKRVMGGYWNHSRWYPINEFTRALYEHNNQ